MRDFKLGVSALAIIACAASATTVRAQDVTAQDAAQGTYDGITASRDAAQATPESTEAPPPSADIASDEPTGGPKGAPPRKRKKSDIERDVGSSDILVTGSRLQGGDATTKTITITQDDIIRRGVTSVEELIRTLPENVATIGAITNERQRGPLQDRGAPVGQLGSLGVAAANLGGIGAGNTLILINGRRVAGAAGIEDGFVNLNGIPLAAIDRVEINTGGSSAVYGADALGGVINFILKRNFIGTTLTGGYEYSNNGADVKRLSANSGYAWGTGNVSATVSYRANDPVNNRKTGYTTNNWSSYYNGDQNYDYRSFANGLQPGVIDTTYYVFDPDTWESTRYVQGLTVRPGVTGRPALSDFITVGPEAQRDYVPKYAGPKSDTLSGSLDFEQKITDKLRVFASGLYTRAKNSQDTPPTFGLNLALAPGQAYNPFPAYSVGFSPNVNVYYFPERELASGEVSYGKIANTTENWSVNGGLSYDFNANTRFEFIYTRSGSKSRARSENFSSLVNRIIPDAANPDGWTCSNYLVDNPQYYTGSDFAAYTDTFNRQCAALTSADPSVAFNPWSSTAGLGAPVSVFYWKDDTENRSSTLQNYEARIRGSLITLPGGDVSYAAGGEYNTDGVNSREIRNLVASGQGRTRYAFFGELSVPIFGREFTLPGIRSLIVDVAARRDVYKTTGPVGTVDNIPVENGGEIEFATNKFGRTTPAFGVRWEPVDTLVLRGRWTKGFRAPPFSQLFNVTGANVYEFPVYGDPLYDCVARQTCDPLFPGQDPDEAKTSGAYFIPRITAPNPDLKPQTSTQQMYNARWTPQGDLSGLTLEVTYNRTRIKNEYANASELGRYLSQTDQYRLAQFFPRDENGRILRYQNQIFNISGSEFASITYNARYLFNTSVGSFEPSITYLDNLKAQRQIFPGTDPINNIGRLQGPDRYKIIGQLNWFYNDLSLSLFGYYTPSYLNDYEVFTYAGVVSNPEYAKKVDDYLTFDLTANLKVGDHMRLNFAGRNIFDAKPPFVVVQGRPYDTSRYNPAGRTLAVQLQYSF